MVQLKSGLLGCTASKFDRPVEGSSHDVFILFIMPVTIIASYLFVCFFATLCPLQLATVFMAISMKDSIENIIARYQI